MKRRLRLFLLRAIGRLLRRSLRSTATMSARAPHILLIRPDHLGDVLLSRPATDALAAALPGAQLTLAVGPWGRPALGQQPRLKVILCPFPGFSRSRLWPLRPYVLLWHYARLLRRGERFDMAVVLRPDHWWGALLAAVAGIPVRVGYETAETAPFLTVALPWVGGRHTAEYALQLAGAAARCAGGTIVPPTPDLPTIATSADRCTVDNLLTDAGITQSRPLLVLHPGAGSRLKSWPLERFATVGAQLAAGLGAQVVVTGSTAERALAQTLCDLLPDRPLNLAGRLQWGELEALLARTAVIVGVDSGPLHLAAAAGTPSVALFGPADPAQFAPWGPPALHRVVYADLPCRPCRRLDYCRIELDGDGPPPCMRGIDAAQVVAAAQAALHERRRAVAATD